MKADFMLERAKPTRDALLDHGAAGRPDAERLPMSAIFDKKKAPRGKANAPPMSVNTETLTCTDSAYPVYKRETERAWFDIEGLPEPPMNESVASRIARDTAIVTLVLGSQAAKFIPQGLVEIALLSKRLVMDAQEQNRKIDPRAAIQDIARRKINIIADQEARGLPLGRVYSDWARPPQTVEGADRCRNIVNSLAKRAGARTTTRAEGGVAITASNLMELDGTLREGAAEAKLLVRGPLSEVDAGSQACSGAGKSLGMGGRSTNKNRGT